MIEIYKYGRKPFSVGAVQVSADNIHEVAKWCGGRVQTVKDEGAASALATPYIKVKVKRPLSARQTKAFVGDWVLQAGTGFKVYTDPAFQKSFDLLDEPMDFVDEQPTLFKDAQ